MQSTEQTRKARPRNHTLTSPSCTCTSHMPVYIQATVPYRLSPSRAASYDATSLCATALISPDRCVSHLRRPRAPSSNLGIVALRRSAISFIPSVVRSYHHITSAQVPTVLYKNLCTYVADHPIPRPTSAPRILFIFVQPMGKSGIKTKKGTFVR
jgi:hypothetical protein